MNEYYTFSYCSSQKRTVRAHFNVLVPDPSDREIRIGQPGNLSITTARQSTAKPRTYTLP